MNSHEEASFISLSELEYLRRLQKYQKRKSEQIEHRLRRLEASCEIRKRMVKCTQGLHHGLSEAIQSGNKRNFALLHRTFRIAEQACDEYDSYPLGPELSARSWDTTKNDFLDGLSPSARDSILDFLSRIAFDPSFLLDRLLCLSNSEFNALLKPISQGSAEHSTFGNPSRKFQDGFDPGVLRSFLDLNRHDPLSFLLQLVTKDGINDCDVTQSGRTRAWGAICAGVLSHQKPGSDRFVVTILNAWSNPIGKPARHSFETWLMETLRDGDFLLDRPEKRPFRMRTQARESLDTEELEATEKFFFKAIKKLLEVVKGSPQAGVIPSATLDLGRNIVERLGSSQRQQQAAPYFLCTRWLFSSFLTTLIRNPESQGLLLSYHVSPNARLRILNEVALRAQKLAFDVAYTWKHSAPVEPELLADVEAVVSLFRPSQQTSSASRGRNAEVVQEKTDMHTPLAYVTACPSDVMTLVDALCPERSSIFQSVTSLTGSTSRSSASSLSGMSLFRANSPNALMAPNDTVSFRAAEDTSFQDMAHVYGESVGSHATDISNLPDEGNTLKLREACSELELTIGYNLEPGNCDPFSETWMTFQVLPSGSFKPCTGLDSVPEDAADIPAAPLNAQVLESGQMKSIRNGVLALLDDFGPLMEDLSNTMDAVTLRAALVERFDHTASFYYNQGNFSKAHAFYQITSIIRSLSRKLTSEEVMPMVQRLSDDFRQSINHSETVIHHCEKRFEHLSGIIDSGGAELKEVSRSLDRLREKMWYIADVQSGSQYEDLRRVSSALRVMGSSVRYPLDKSQPPLRHRGASRPISQDLQLKAEAATLELLSAPVGRGGPNKLSDIQTQMTLDWMQSHGIENLCKAEERLHRFCLEISRCADSFVGETMAENPILWSSELYQQQRPLSGSQSGRKRSSDLEESPLKQFNAFYVTRAFEYNNANPPSSFQWDRGQWPTRPLTTIHSTDSLNSSFETQDYLGHRSPTLTSNSSATFWSSFSAGAQSPSSATSLPSRTFSPVYNDRPSSCLTSSQPSRASFLEELKQNLTGLLLSDFGHLFRDGSETDRVLRDPLKGRPFTMSLQNAGPISMDHHSERTSAFEDRRQDLSSDNQIFSSSLPERPQTHRKQPQQQHESLSIFNFDEVFRRLLIKFELQPSPYVKLDVLLELQCMLEAHETVTSNQDDRRPDSSQTSSSEETQGRFRLRIDTFLSPRTSLGQDAAVAGFRRLFQHPEVRPKPLFRDLQYIASLVPLHVLDSTARGRAFWNATIASLDLKQEICQDLIETADEIISFHTFNRGHSRVTSAAQAQRDSANFPPPSTSPKPDERCASANDVTKLSMADAATLLQATAKEGIPAAQRELATLYLTHPELLGVCMAPFSRPKDVVKDRGPAATVASRKEKEKSERDRERYDPVAMAMAQHWMEFSAKGGDVPAAKYLRAKDEFEKIP